MAKESKTLSVSPSEEQSTVEFWQDFGWELVSSQEIFNEYQKTSVDYQGNKTLSTERTHYVKLVFSRDTTIANHDELAQLEKKLPPLPNKVKNIWAYFLLIAIVSLFACVALSGGTFQGPLASALLITSIASAVFSVVLLILAKAEYNKKLSIALAKRNAIRQEAKKLV